MTDYTIVGIVKKTHFKVRESCEAATDVVELVAEALRAEHGQAVTQAVRVAQDLAVVGNLA